MEGRFRRLRKSEEIRGLIRETHLKIEDFIYPLFIVEGTGIKREIPSLPDVYHFSVDMIEAEMKELKELGLKKLLIFGVPNEKDEKASSAFAEDGIVQKAIRKIKEVDKSFYVITDVCMCQYTSHGHCGILDDEGVVINDVTLGYLTKIAVSHAAAGADMVAPSDMMDLRISALRTGLDAAGFEYVALMSYSAKYCSSYYGPFRDAAGSAPKSGDRKTYQMDYYNSKEAIRTSEFDILSGADIIMVKPALAYMDIIRRLKDEFDYPLAAYNVSGEYAMMKHAVMNGIMNEEVIMETMVAFKRAGADIIITYFAKEVAQKLIDRR